MCENLDSDQPVSPSQVPAVHLSTSCKQLTMSSLLRQSKANLYDVVVFLFRKHFVQPFLEDLYTLILELNIELQSQSKPDLLLDCCQLWSRELSWTFDSPGGTMWSGSRGVCVPCSYREQGLRLRMLNYVLPDKYWDEYWWRFWFTLNDITEYEHYQRS